MVSTTLPLIVLAHQLPFTGTRVLDTRWVQFPNIVVKDRFIDVLETWWGITTTRHPDVAFEECAH